MPLLIPNEVDAAVADQATLFRQNFDVLSAIVQGVDTVVFGCAVTGGASMTPAVAKGGVLSNGVLLPVTAGTVTIGAAHASLPRWDLIVVDSSGTKAVRAGTADDAPIPPDRTANDVVLAQVYVEAAVTTIPTARITDQRITRDRDITLKRATTAVTHNTSSAAETYATLVCPSGLMIAGRLLLMRLGGDYKINNSTPTITLTIDYGGTTMVADATAAFTADTDRGAWDVELILNASANTVQQVSGRIAVQTPGAKTAATNGETDLAVVTHVGAPFYGAATVDSDAADRTLNVKLTMSVSHVDDEIVCAYSYARLL